jgi:hypothetical protein
LESFDARLVTVCNVIKNSRSQEIRGGQLTFRRPEEDARRCPAENGLSLAILATNQQTHSIRINKDQDLSLVFHLYGFFTDR